jgi:hypothetical protein
MKLNIGKYAFNSKEQALDKIKKLGIGTDEEGNEYPTHKHTVVELGFEALSEPVIDPDAYPPVVIEYPTFGTDYLVDVLWADLEEEDGSVRHPYGWATYSVDVSEEGVHSFLGLTYQELKITNN